MYIINPDVIDEIPKGYKECTKCHRIRPLSAFHYYKPKAKIKKRRPECIECEHIRNNLARYERSMTDPNYFKRYYMEHREHILQLNKERERRKKKK